MVHPFLVEAIVVQSLYLIATIHCEYLHTYTYYSSPFLTKIGLRNYISDSLEVNIFHDVISFEFYA